MRKAEKRFVLNLSYSAQDHEMDFLYVTGAFEPMGEDGQVVGVHCPHEWGYPRTLLIFALLSCVLVRYSSLCINSSFLIFAILFLQLQTPTNAHGGNQATSEQRTLTRFSSTKGNQAPELLVGVATQTSCWAMILHTRDSLTED